MKILYKEIKIICLKFTVIANAQNYFCVCKLEFIFELIVMQCNFLVKINLKTLFITVLFLLAVFSVMFLN